MKVAEITDCGRVDQAALCAADTHRRDNAQYNNRYKAGGAFQERKNPAGRLPDGGCGCLRFNLHVDCTIAML